MPTRVSPVEQIRAEIDELFASEQELGQVLEQVARLSVRLVIQAALEAEVTEFLGRDRYARGERDRVGYRNGHAELQVKTTAGPVVLERPKLRGTDQAVCLAAVGQGGVAHQCAGGAGAVGVCAWPIRARRGGRAGRGAGPRGGAVAVDRQPDLRGDQDQVRCLDGPRPVRDRAGVPVLRWQPLSDAPGRSGRAGAVRLGDHHPGGAGAGRG